MARARSGSSSRSRSNRSNSNNRPGTPQVITRTTVIQNRTYYNNNPYYYNGYHYHVHRNYADRRRYPEQFRDVLLLNIGINSTNTIIIDTYDIIINNYSIKKNINHPGTITYEIKDFKKSQDMFSLSNIQKYNDLNELSTIREGYFRETVLRNKATWFFIIYEGNRYYFQNFKIERISGSAINKQESTMAVWLKLVIYLMFLSFVYFFIYVFMRKEPDIEVTTSNNRPVNPRNNL
tara:strand:- start:2933 stop:3637 length:705 start_codon:yes stop_codon:yes gene_type:complete